jgi:hypothetical protein
MSLLRRIKTGRSCLKGDKERKKLFSAVHWMLNFFGLIFFSNLRNFFHQKCRHFYFVSPFIETFVPREPCLPDFSGHNLPKWGKYTKWPQNYPLDIKYTKTAENISNGHKIYQNWPFQGPPKYTHIEIFGIKINQTIWQPWRELNRLIPREQTKQGDQIGRIFVYCLLFAPVY